MKKPAYRFDLLREGPGIYPFRVPFRSLYRVLAMKKSCHAKVKLYDPDHERLHKLEPISIPLSDFKPSVQVAAAT